MLDHKQAVWSVDIIGGPFINGVNPPGPSGRADLDVIPHLWPPLSAIQVNGWVNAEIVSVKRE
jgi:hypothetical protein